MYKIYVIPGSHACRSAMLMLEHKQVPYKRINFITGTHSVMARLHGFTAGGETRTANGKRTFGLRLGDSLGTVPGLAADGDRVSTNHGIARYLDKHHHEPPLFPADLQQRAAVEEAESWANETLQMAARRIAGAAIVRDPVAASHEGADGRLGYILYRRRLARRFIVPQLVRQVFATSADPDRDPIAELPVMLDRVDNWIADGVLGGERLNAADFMVAPSLALILYRPDAQPIFAGRPALGLVDRLLPEPG